MAKDIAYNSLGEIAMKCWIDKLPTGEDSFWGISEDNAFIEGLKIGAFIGMKQSDIDWCHAKALCFLAGAPNWTPYSFLNIAIAIARGMDMVNINPEDMMPYYKFIHAKRPFGYVYKHIYKVYDKRPWYEATLEYEGSYKECLSYIHMNKAHDIAYISDQHRYE